MSGQEAVFFAAALVAVFAVTYFFFERKAKAALVVTLLGAPAVFLALERGSQFTTADEKRILRETLEWGEGSTIKEWNLGAFRTSTAVLTPLARIVQTQAHEASLETRLALLKNVHWLAGFALFLSICCLTHRAMALPRRPWCWLGLFYAVLLLPIHLMALKILNYDQFALQFTVLAVLAGMIMIREDNPRLGWLSIACGLLGAQEKLSAGPFLLLAIVLYAFVQLRNGWRVGKIARAVLTPLAICAGLGAVTHLIALSTRSFDSSSFKHPWIDVVDPLISWVWVVHKFVFGGANFAQYRWLHLGVSVAAMLLATVLLLGLVRLGSDARSKRALRSFVRIARPGLLLLFIGCGLWGTFAVTAYWHPYHPVAPGEFMPGGEMNKATLHFASSSYGEHLRRAICFHSAVFLNSIPSVILLAALIAALARTRRKEDAPRVPGADLITCVALLTPAAFALINMPFGHRYMNFAIMLLTLVVCGETLLMLNRWGKWRRASAIGVAIVALVLEIAPFRPAYFPFRPIWSPHQYPDARTPIVGLLNPTWLGWGEETMLGGELLDRWIRTKRISLDNGRPILYVRYYADWLNPSPLFAVKSLIPHLKELNYSADEYFLVNRTTYVQDACVFPDGVEPEYVLSYRGYAQAWIFRGDKLKAAGYRF